MRLARIFFCDWRHLRSRWAGFGRRKRIRNKIQTRSTRESKKKEDGQGIVAAAALLFNAVATWSCLFSWSVGACASSDRRVFVERTTYGRSPAKVVEIGGK